MGLSVAAAFAGLFMARRAYLSAGKGYTEPIAAAAPPVYDTLLNKYYVDEGYDYVFTGRRRVGDVRLGVMGLGEASSWFDTNVVDGAVNAAGWITRFTATFPVGGTSGSSTGYWLMASPTRRCHFHGYRGFSNGAWCSGMRWS